MDSTRKRPAEQLAFYKVKSHFEIDKVVGRKRYHLSWPDLESLHADLEVFLDARLRNISLKELLDNVSETDDRGKILLPGPKGKIPFRKFCEEILPRHRADAAGWKVEGDRIRWIVENAPFAARNLHSIRSADLTRLYKSYCERPQVKSDHTRGHMIKAIRTIFRVATELEYIREDPSAKLKPPPMPDSTRDSFTKGEVVRLFNAATPRLRRWILMALYTGLRPVEVRRSTVAQIDLEERCIKVMGRTVKNRPRKFYIHDELLPVIETCAASVPNLPLFRDTNDTPATFPRKDWNRVRESVGLHGRPFYAFRHTFASWLLESGTLDEETRAYLMGHRLPRMTAMYTHVTWRKIREAIERLPRITSADEESTTGKRREVTNTVTNRPDDTVPSNR